MSPPWHFTTWLDLLDHWQTFIAGLAALIAAIITVGVTLRVERGKADREVDALRRSLALDLRQQIPRALAVFKSLALLGSRSDGPISARMVESQSRMPASSIYLANAGKIGLLEGDGMDVLIVYTLLEGAQDGVARLMTSRTPDNITPAVVTGTADVFLEACKYARGVLPRLRTGNPLHDAKDEVLLQQINEAAAARPA